MSATPAVFHSSDVDNQTLLAEGWYIGFIVGGDLTTEGAVGPYRTERDAKESLRPSGAIYTPAIRRYFARRGKA